MFHKTVAIEEEPLDSVISDTILKVYGNASFEGSEELIALHASFTMINFHVFQFQFFQFHPQKKEGNCSEA